MWLLLSLGRSLCQQAGGSQSDSGGSEVWVSGLQFQIHPGLAAETCWLLPPAEPWKNAFCRRQRLKFLCPWHLR